MKIKNPETGEVIVIPQGMEDAVRDAIESGNDPMEAMQMKYGGIHINPANKGKFNATKKATGKTTEELTHSKNPLTRKRAIFAQNAKKWKHQEGGQAMEQQDQMQQLVQMAEQALAQGTPPEKVAQMLVQQGVPEQVVQQVIQYAIQDLEQTQGQNPQEEAQEQGQQQNPQEEQDEMKYGGIHIKESKKGTFTAAATKHGMGVQEFAKKVLANKDNYSPAMVKKANFAHNAASWHHEYGGMAMYEEGGQLPESLLRTRMKASGASNEEINDYISKNYNYGGMTMYGHGGMIKRADGSYSKRGLWDNIRANKGSGKAPTKEMLKQEKKIKAAEKGMGGMMYADGGKLPKDILKSRLESHMSPQEVNNYLKEYANGGSFDNPGFRALPTYVQEKIKSNMAYGGCMECGGKMETGGRFLRKAQVGLYDDNLPYNPEYNSANSLNTFGNFQNPLEQYSFNDAYNPNRPIYPQTQFSQKTNNTFISPKNPRPQQDLIDSIPLGGYDQFGNIKSPQGLQGYNPETGGNLGLKNSMTTIGNIPSTIYNGKQYDTKNNKSNKFNDYAGNLANITGGNSYFGRGIQHLGQATFDFTKGGIEMAGNNISNRNALQDEANNLRSAMRAGYQKTGKRPTDGNAIISKYGGKMMQDGGATYADKMKVSKNSPKADFIAEKGEYIVNNGIASKLETGGSHASGNDTAISLDKSQSPSYVLSDTPRLKQLQFGGKRVSPAKYAEMATVEALGKTPDQILKGYTAFTKRAGTEGKVFEDKISDSTNQLLAQKYQKDLATVKQIADQAYHKQEQLKHAMGMDNDLDHAQQVNGMSMAKFGGMQDGVHMNYFNAPAVQYGGSPQLFSDPSGLGYNTTQMAYGGLHKMQNAGNANPYSDWKGQTFSTPEGYTTPTNVNLNVEPRRNWADYAQYYSSYDPRITTKQTPEAIAALQEVIYDDYLDTPQGQEALNQMWLEYGVTNQLEKDYSDIAEKIKKKENLTESDLKRLRANYIDKLAGKRLPKMLPNAPASETTPKPEAIESKPPVVESQEVDKKPFEYTPAEKKDTYDIPPVNFYIPQSYGRNPIGLQLAQAQTIRPAKLNIQPELNEYNRSMRGALRGTQGNTSVNVAQQMQGLNNLYDAQNKLFGQKYNFDEQSRAGADQFNAQAMMNTDAANIQRIGVNQDAIARREGALDTQRRTDFQAGLENADKQNAYNLSKKYIESTFGPYLNNEGKLNFTYNPLTAEKNTKEKSYTASELNKMTAEQRKALGLKFGGSVKKIKLKLRK